MSNSIWDQVQQGDNVTEYILAVLIKESANVDSYTISNRVDIDALVIFLISSHGHIITGLQIA